jgi:hypothetical protein
MAACCTGSTSCASDPHPSNCLIAWAVVQPRLTGFGFGLRQPHVRSPSAAVSTTPLTNQRRQPVDPLVLTLSTVSTAPNAQVDSFASRRSGVRIPLAPHILISGVVAAPSFWRRSRRNASVKTAVVQCMRACRRHIGNPSHGCR